jgi:hypothetical protein
MRRVNAGSKTMIVLGLGVAALLVLAPAAAGAAKFKVVYSQCAEADCADGRGGSTGPLVMDAAGNFYGTTPDEKAFVLKRSGKRRFKYKAILSFGVGEPTGGMIIDTQGNLYGWAGQFYKMTYGPFKRRNKWNVAFPPLNCSTPPCGGADPMGTLSYTGAASGAPWDGVSPLYGVMSQGGVNNGGTVYQLTPENNGFTYTVLYNFCSRQNCADGNNPTGVVLDGGGHLYGNAVFGGISNAQIPTGAGVVFELSQSKGSWTETVLHSFCSAARCADGIFPTASLAQDATGNLIGITESGGSPRKNALGGVLFKLTPNGAQSQETVLYNFCQLKDCKDGSYPFGTPLLDETGNVFGTTEEGGGNDIDRSPSGGGIAYELTGSTLRILHRFCSQAACSDGEGPSVGLSRDGSGHVLGTTDIGGAFGEGVIYELRP